MDERSWLRLMDDLGISSNLSTFEDLTRAYGESHRYYHTARHIEACLVHFEQHRHFAENPAEVECAIWFHDAIYNPLSKNNELKSATWAERFLRDNLCSEKLQETVRNLILATVHDANATDLDTQLLVDIDLTILGTDEETYDLFERNVRREYRWVPGPLYRRERRKILESFLARKTIYFTSSFRERFETQARSNLARAFQRLG